MDFKTAFDNHRRSALHRGISFLFTFEEWRDWWLIDNRWERRGRLSNSLCMGRINDEGPYAPTNVKCITQFENKKEITRERRRASHKKGADSRRAVRIRTPDGDFNTRSEAANYYGVSGAAISYRVKNWSGWAYL